MTQDGKIKPNTQAREALKIEQRKLAQEAKAAKRSSAIDNLRANPQGSVSDQDLSTLFDQMTITRIRQAFNTTPITNSAILRLLSQGSLSNKTLNQVAGQARSEQARQRALNDPETKSLLHALNELGEGPYTLNQLVSLLGEEEVSAHQECRVLEVEVTRKQAVHTITSPNPKAQTLIPTPHSLIDPGRALSVLNLPKRSLSDLTYYLGIEPLTHAKLHKLIIEQQTDSAAFKQALAEAGVARREERENKAAQRVEEKERKVKERQERTLKIDTANEERKELGLDTHRSHPDEVRTSDVAKVLGVSQNVIRTHIKNKNISAHLVNIQTNYGHNDLWFIPLEELINLKNNPPNWLTQAQGRNKVQQEKAKDIIKTPRVTQRERNLLEAERAAVRSANLDRREDRNSHKKPVLLVTEEAKSAVRIKLPLRTVKPKYIHAHLGPTNSGKTHDAVQALKKAGRGVYAAPLRALALEIYLRLSAELGKDKVGLITGEEQVNETAPIICCTPECAPMNAHTLVLDEVHWVNDEDRGWAWARLLAGMNVDNLIIIGAGESENLLKEALGETLQVTHHNRMTPITYKGPITPEQVTAGTLVVAFSRKSVLALARTLSARTNLKVGVLYGMMPPQARRESIKGFMDKRTDILVVTDVIGHGINLPTKAVVLAETEKYDGHERRDLRLWEAAQILGRAGRYRLSAAGETYTLTETGLGLNVNAKLVQQATLVASGKAGSGLVITHGELRPTLTDLGCETPLDLEEHLLAWKAQATQALKAHPWLRSKGVETLTDRLALMRKDRLRLLSLIEAWLLLTLPVDNQESLDEFTDALAHGQNLTIPPVKLVSRMRLQEAEAAAAYARDAMAFTRAFGDDYGITHRQCQNLEQAASERIVKLLPGEVKANTYGQCRNCHKPCPPWFDTCQKCHNSRYDW